MYFYPVSSFLSAFAQRSNYSSFLNGSFWRGLDGLIPRYGGGRPMKLSSDELDRLIEILNQKTTWTTDDVRTMIHQEFGVEYTLNPYYPKEVLLFKYLPVFHSNPFWFSQSVP